MRQIAAVSTLEEFLRDETLYDATLRNLEIIGEAAGKVSTETMNHMQDIEWRSIISLRHVLAHGYYSIDDTIIWQIATQRVPELEQKLDAYLSESGDERI